MALAQTRVSTYKVSFFLRTSSKLEEISLSVCYEL